MGISSRANILIGETEYLKKISLEQRNNILLELQKIVGKDINSILSSMERGNSIYDYLKNIGLHSDNGINHTKYQITIADYLTELSDNFSKTFESLVFDNIQHVTKNFIVDCETKRGVENELGKNKNEGIHFFDEINSKGEIGYIKLLLVNGEYFYLSIKTKSSQLTCISLKHKADIVALYNYFQAYQEHIYQSCELIDAKYVDSLTGLYNVGFSKELLAEKVEEDQQEGITEESEDKEKVETQYYSLIFFDVADFKTINDVYGHVVGDKVLEEIGKILKKTMRPGDYAVRLGGDEMGLIINNKGETDIKIIQKNLDRIQERLNEQLAHLNVFDIKVSVVTSNAISTKKGFKDLDELKDEADGKLDKGQEGKANRMVEFLLKNATDSTIIKILNQLYGSDKIAKFTLPIQMEHIKTLEYFIHEVNNNPDYKKLMKENGISNESIENAKILAKPLLLKFNSDDEVKKN